MGRQGNRVGNRSDLARGARWERRGPAACPPPRPPRDASRSMCSRAVLALFALGVAGKLWGGPVAETGRVTFSQANRNAWQTVQLRGRYDRPALLCGR